MARGTKVLFAATMVSFYWSGLVGVKSSDYYHLSLIPYTGQGAQIPYLPIKNVTNVSCEFKGNFDLFKQKSFEDIHCIAITSCSVHVC